MTEPDTLADLLAEDIPDDFAPWTIQGEYLMCDGYGLELSSFQTLEDLGFWADHLAGKGWVTDSVIGGLVRAFAAIHLGGAS